MLSMRWRRGVSMAPRRTRLVFPVVVDASGQNRRRGRRGRARTRPGRPRVGSGTWSPQRLRCSVTTRGRQSRNCSLIAGGREERARYTAATPAITYGGFA
jgi:hypothetical protein